MTRRTCRLVVEVRLLNRHGSSAMNVSLCFCRYDVELFQKIEALTGLKMELYPTDQARMLCQCCGVGACMHLAKLAKLVHVMACHALPSHAVALPVQEAVMLLQERVNEAQRLATQLMKETDKNKKGSKRKGSGNDAEDAGQMFKRKYGKK